MEPQPEQNPSSSAPGDSRGNPDFPNEGGAVLGATAARAVEYGRRVSASAVPALKNTGSMLKRLWGTASEYAKMLRDYYRWLMKPKNPGGETTPESAGELQPLGRIYFHGNWKGEREKKSLPKFQVKDGAADAEEISKTIQKMVQERHPDTEIGTAWEGDVIEGKARTLRFVDRMKQGFVSVADLRMFTRGQDLLISVNSHAWSKLKFYSRVFGTLAVILLFVLAASLMGSTTGFRKSWVRDFAKKHADTSSVSNSVSTGWSSGNSSSGSSTSQSFTNVEPLEDFIENGRELFPVERVEVYMRILTSHPELASLYSEKLAALSTGLRKITERKWVKWKTESSQQTIQSKNADAEQLTIEAMDLGLAPGGLMGRMLEAQNGITDINILNIRAGIDNALAQSSFEEKLHATVSLWLGLLISINELESVNSGMKQYWQEMERVLSGRRKSSDNNTVIHWEDAVRANIPKEITEEIDDTIAEIQPKRWSTFKLFWADWSLFIMGPGKILAMVFGALGVLVMWVPKSALRMVCEFCNWPAPQTFDEFVDSQVGELQIMLSDSLLEFGIAEQRILRL